MSKTIASCMLALFAFLGSASAHAKGGSDISVSTSAAVQGSTVSGTVTITNAGSSPATITQLTDWLEVRYPSGTNPPPYPPGTTADSYRVGEVPIAWPTIIPGNGSLTLSYSVNTCRDVSSYQGAKDMRNAVVVTVVGAKADARTITFLPPNQLLCPVCGNGKVEAGEQCDGGGCCTSSCVLQSDGWTCNDGNGCTQTDQCLVGACVGANPVLCLASDQCHAAGTCAPATGSCSNPSLPGGTVCNDGDPCSTSDVCTAGQCHGAPMVCNDGNACTDDTCVGGTCAASNNTAACEDGDRCTGNDRCAEGACVAGSPVTCSDHLSCTDDTCQSEVGCAHADAATCDTCDASECAICQSACTDDHDACVASCWTGFFGCLDGCSTQTYCAPFCQVDLGTCFNGCPNEPACQTHCEVGNACGPGCIAAP